MTKSLLHVWGQPETLYVGFCSRKVIWSLPLAGTVVNLQFTVLHKIAPPEWRWHADSVLYSLVLDTGQIQGSGISTFLHWPLGWATSLGPYINSHQCIYQLQCCLLSVSLRVAVIVAGILIPVHFQQWHSTWSPYPSTGATPHVKGFFRGSYAYNLHKLSRPLSCSANGLSDWYPLLPPVDVAVSYSPRSVLKTNR